MFICTQSRHESTLSPSCQETSSPYFPLNRVYLWSIPSLLTFYPEINLNLIHRRVYTKNLKLTFNTLYGVTGVSGASPRHVVTDT